MTLKEVNIILYRAKVPFLWKLNLILVHKTVLFGFKSDRYVKCVFELQQYNYENINCIFFIIFCMSDLLSNWQSIWFKAYDMMQKMWGFPKTSQIYVTDWEIAERARTVVPYDFTPYGFTSTMISSWNIWRYFSAAYQIFYE